MENELKTLGLIFYLLNHQNRNTDLGKIKISVYEKFEIYSITQPFLLNKLKELEKKGIFSLITNHDTQEHEISLNKDAFYEYCCQHSSIFDKIISSLESQAILQSDILNERTEKEKLEKQIENYHKIKLKCDFLKNSNYDKITENIENALNLLQDVKIKSKNSPNTKNSTECKKKIKK